MCTVVHGDCGCDHSGSGFGPAESVAVLAGLAAVGAGYVVLETFWPLALVLWLATAALAAKRVRTALRRGLGWLLREMWRSWTTRHDRPTVPGRDVALARAWHVVLYGDGQELTSGTVVGTWLSAAELVAETKERALLAYDERGERPPLSLTCSAEPVA